MIKHLRWIILLLAVLVALPASFLEAEETQTQAAQVQTQTETQLSPPNTNQSETNSPTPFTETLGLQDSQKAIPAPEAVAQLPQPGDLNFVSVEDISDRFYLDKVLDVIQKSKESIYVSMYVSNPKAGDKHPVGRLFQALTDATQRGVKVQVWMSNSFSDEKIADRKKFDPFWKDVQEKGIKIQWAPSGHLLHDKLIVVDREYVVEGSTNWTYSAILKNFESATLIRSKALAEKKIERLEALPIQKPENLNPLQVTYVDLPVELFTDAGSLPKVANRLK